MRKQIKQMMADGVYDQNVIFNKLYPVFNGHYSRLRDMISEVKNNA